MPAQSFTPQPTPHPSAGDPPFTLRPADRSGLELDFEPSLADDGEML